MLRFAVTPDWFYNIGVAFGVLAIIVLITISAYCYFCYYLRCHSDNYKYFSAAFLSMAVAFVFKIFSNFSLVYNEVQQANIGNILITITSIKQSHIPFIVGNTFHYFFWLAGLLILWILVYKQYNKYTITLLALFVLLATFFSSVAYFIFYLTSSVLLAFLFSKYWRNHTDKKTKKSFTLAVAFFSLLVSHFIFIFIWLHQYLYVVAETIQLLGFLLLLFTFIAVIRRDPSGLNNAKKN